MPECQNCGHHVSSDYVRVFAQPDADEVFCCPWCDDELRSNGKVREAKSQRKDPHAQTTYDPEARS